MKVYATTDHDSFYPVGSASVAFVKDKRRARLLIDKALKNRGLKTSKEAPYEIFEIKPDSAIVLNDGNY